MNFAAYLRLIGYRALQFVPVVLFATIIVFGLLKLVPGDPAVTLAGENATDELIQRIRETYGFDRPFLVQYWDWLSKVLHGDLSRSMMSGESVARLIAQSLPNTMVIVVLSLFLSLAIGIPLGVIAATRARTKTDAVISSISSLGVALPNFWLGMILVGLFALHWRLFPATGAKPITEDFWGSLHSAALPAFALAASGVAEVSRQLRSALIEVLSSQYVRTLRAKGLSSAAILWKHGLKNVSVNLLTVTGLIFSRLLGATVVVEAVFAVPGMGGLIVSSAINKDFPVVQGVVFVLVIMVILTNLLIDILYSILDPRVRPS